MRRLLRTIITLLAINAVCIALVIVAHNSDTAWDCLSFYFGPAVNPDLQLLDPTTGKFIANQPYPVWDRNISSSIYNADRLIYNYRSPSQTHRIGVVTTQSHNAHHYLDFHETDGNFTIQWPPSPNLEMLPIATFDSVRQSQTVTLYTADTLTSIVTVAQSPVIAPSTQYDLFPVSWSPDGHSFWFPTATESRLSVTVLLHSGLSVTLPLQGKGYPLNLQYMWSKTGRSVAISSATGGHYIDIFIAENEAWANARHFYLDGGLDSLVFERWSSDEQTLYLHKFGDIRTTGSTTIQTLAFSMKSQRLVEIEERQSDEVPLHLNEQWICNQASLDTPAQLVSLSGEHPPIPLVDFAENQGACTLTDDPTESNLIIAMPSTSPDDIQWAVLSADPFEIKPITLPPQTRFILTWLENGAKAVFFTRDIVETQEYVGHLGIFDLASSRWQLLPYPIVFGAGISYSPDRTRFTISSADQQLTYLFSSDGQLLAAMPFATDNGFDLLWTPNSSRIALIHYAPSFALDVYDRDGHQLANLHTHSTYLPDTRANFASCAPLPKFPRLNLPH